MTNLETLFTGIMKSSDIELDTEALRKLWKKIRTEAPKKKEKKTKFWGKICKKKRVRLFELAVSQQHNTRDIIL